MKLIITNKLDSISLVLNESSKTLEKLDPNNSKLLQDNFEFFRQEILSKDNYLMETQTAILNLVTLAKYQEKNIGEITKVRCSTTTTTISTKSTYTTTFSTRGI